MNKVGLSDLRQEIKRVREETDINPYITFTYDERPVINAQVSVAGIGARDLADMEDFARDLQKVIDIVKTFKYQGYELDYDLQVLSMVEKYNNENKTSEAQVKAVRNWEKNNPEKAKYIRYKSSAKTFARHWADDEDMKEVLEVYKNENPNCNLA